VLTNASRPRSGHDIVSSLFGAPLGSCATLLGFKDFMGESASVHVSGSMATLTMVV
jgi:hypothetical protein